MRINFNAFPICRDRKGARRVLEEFQIKGARLPSSGRVTIVAVPSSGTLTFSRLEDDLFRISAEPMAGAVELPLLP